jgi:hypothetical protein
MDKQQDAIRNVRGTILHKRRNGRLWAATKYETALKGRDRSETNCNERVDRKGVKKRTARRRRRQTASRWRCGRSRGRDVEGECGGRGKGGGGGGEVVRGGGGDKDDGGEKQEEEARTVKTKEKKRNQATETDRAAERANKRRPPKDITAVRVPRVLRGVDRQPSLAAQHPRRQGVTTGVSPAVSQREAQTCRFARSGLVSPHDCVDELGLGPDRKLVQPICPWAGLSDGVDGGAMECTD